MPTKVLIVEDESIIALDLQRRLINLGYEAPRIAATREQTMAAIREIEPDMVLMDINIAGAVDGIDTAAELKVPFIFLTAYSEEKTLERARQTKPYGYLLKPYSERELHATIQMALERHRHEMRLRQNEIQMATIYSKLALANKELRGTANELFVDKQLLEITLRSGSDGVIATDKLGNVTFLNSVAEQQTGWSLLQAFGKPLSKILVFVDEKNQMLEQAEIEQIIYYKKNSELNRHTLLGRQGVVNSIQHSLTYLHDLEKKAAGVVFVFRNINDDQ